MPAILNSWKEIATYLHRGVRTVQRWEAEKHLPVHRIGEGKKAPVFAFEEEVRTWMRRYAINQGSAETASTFPPSRWRSTRSCELIRHRELLSETQRLLSVHQIKCATLMATVNEAEKRLQLQRKAG
jgi:hypothetical protein